MSITTDDHEVDEGQKKAKKLTSKYEKRSKKETSIEENLAGDHSIKHDKKSKKEKKKKDKDVEGEDIEDRSDEKKLKRRNEKGKEREVIEDEDEQSSETKKEKKKKRKSRDEEEEDVSDKVQKKQHKNRKRNHLDEDAEEQQLDDTSVVGDKSVRKEKKEKKKHRSKTSRREDGDIDLEEGSKTSKPDSDTEESPPRKKSKKHKHKSKNLNPEEDSTLSEQARKALTYAYQKAVVPDTWKFNKAKQNWLLRNFWSEQAIPSDYTMLAVSYLSTVQGGVRQELIKTCQNNSKLTSGALEQTLSTTATTIPVPVEQPTATESPAIQNPSTISQNNEEKVKRAETLLLALHSTIL